MSHVFDYGTFDAQVAPVGENSMRVQVSPTYDQDDRPLIYTSAVVNVPPGWDWAMLIKRNLSLNPGSKRLYSCVEAHTEPAHVVLRHHQGFSVHIPKSHFSPTKEARPLKELLEGEARRNLLLAVRFRDVGAAYHFQAYDAEDPHLYTSGNVSKEGIDPGSIKESGALSCSGSGQRYSHTFLYSLRQDNTYRCDFHSGMPTLPGSLVEGKWKPNQVNAQPLVLTGPAAPPEDPEDDWEVDDFEDEDHEDEDYEEEVSGYPHSRPVLVQARISGDKTASGVPAHVQVLYDGGIYQSFDVALPVVEGLPFPNLPSLAGSTRRYFRLLHEAHYPYRVWCNSNSGLQPINLPGVSEIKSAEL